MLIEKIPCKHHCHSRRDLFPLLSKQYILTRKKQSFFCCVECMYHCPQKRDRKKAESKNTSIAQTLTKIGEKQYTCIHKVYCFSPISVRFCFQLFSIAFLRAATSIIHRNRIQPRKIFNPMKTLFLLSLCFTSIQYIWITSGLASFNAHIHCAIAALIATF